MRRWGLFAALLAVVIVMLTGCLAGPNPLAREADPSGRLAGFWHGILAPVTFVLSLFVKSIHFYEVHNSGNWYNLGFVIGAGILFGGGMFGSRKHND